MATESIKIVDPDMGTGYNYASLYAWEAGEQADLPTLDRQATAKCRCTGGTADTTAVGIDGWTTDATRFIKIWTDPAEGYRHNGTYQIGNKYRIEVSDADPAFGLAENYITVNGIQLKATATAHWKASIQTTADLARGANLIKISHSLFWMVGNYINRGPFLASYAVARFFNNIIIQDSTYDHDAAAALYAGGEPTSGYGVPWYFNNTIISGTYGTVGGGSNILLINNLCKGASTKVYTGTFSTPSNYNASSDGTSTGGGQDRTTCTFSFVNEDGDDFHLASDDTGAKDYGVSDPGSGLFSDDIDSQTRSGSWDIGADEYVAAGPTQKSMAGSGPLLSADVTRFGMMNRDLAGDL